MKDYHDFIFFIFILVFCVPVCFAQFQGGVKDYQFPFQDPVLPLEKRVNDLVSRMTLEEKVSQMVHPAAAVERLGIPQYNWWNECLHGVARAGRATVFPQAIGLAAMWDSDFMHRISTVISDEARAKHHEFLRKGKRNIYQGLTFWSPNINIFRDPRWGRGMETYGEDPYLTGKTSIAFITGLQGDNPKYLKTVATVKHYAVHSGPEPDRHIFNVITDERGLRETYLPHFRMSVVEGKAFSVMGAYNRYRGESCSASKLLLLDILRDEWGFEGYVVSDCGAISDIFRTHKIVGTPAEAAALGVKNGCDLNCGAVYNHLVEAVEKGYLAENDIDVAVRRLFTARFKLGMFDPPEMVPYTKIPYSVVDCDEHRKIALEATRKSIVLLKNENNLLPLKKDIGTVAVIGPNADDVEVLLGNYNGNPTNPVTPLQGIKRKVSFKTKVLYAPGCDWAENMPSLEVVPSSAFFTGKGSMRQNGLIGEYFDNNEFTGNPVFTRIDKKIDFNWWDGAPDESFDDDNFGVRWTGELVPPVTGDYYLGANGFSGFRFYLDDELFLRFESSHHPNTRFKKVFLETGKSYNIRVEVYEKLNDAHMKLVWKVPGKDLKKEAVESAKKSDVVIMAMGLSPRLEGEEMNVPVKGFKGGDRIEINLPDVQEDLIKTIGELGKPVVLVLLNGSAVAVNWADKNLPAIIEAWYPGQAAGTALADVLFGDYNPAGRLPVTFYKSADQLPSFKDYTMTDRTYRYFKGEPLYPFGHGLSYTTFTYGNLQLPVTVPSGETVTISAEVKNIGTIGGEEVVQLYVTDMKASVPVPVRSLQGFKRIYLNPGEIKTVEFTLTPRQISLIDRSGRRIIEPGKFEISIGGKQPGFKGNANAHTTNVIKGQFDVTGDIKILEK